MNIVIGTPVRDIKAYSIERWLKAISLLDWPDPIKIIAVDNTDDTEQEKFATFLNSKIVAASIDRKTNPIELRSVKSVYGLEAEARLVKSRELFRQRLIELKADVWFSLECDVIPPPETLKVLTPLLSTFDIVRHDYPDRLVKTQRMNGIGCSLFKMSVLNQFPFADGVGFGQSVDPSNQNCFYGNEGWLIERAVRAGFKMAEVTGLLTLQHLSEAE